VTNIDKDLASIQKARDLCTRAREAMRSFQFASQEEVDGGLRVVVEGRDRVWLIGLVLSAGRHLIAVEPADLAHDATEAAQQALNSYDTDAE